MSFIANLHRTLDLRVSVQRELLNEMASWAVDRSRCLLSPVNPQTGNQDLSRTKYCDLHRKKVPWWALQPDRRFALAIGTKIGDDNCGSVHVHHSDAEEPSVLQHHVRRLSRFCAADRLR